MTKACTKCGEVKPLSEYSRDRRLRDGRRADCKTCQAKRKAAYYQQNREQVQESCAKYRRANSERLIEYRATRYQENRDDYRRRNAAYYQRNREQLLEYHAARQAGNPHISWERHYRERIEKYGFPPFVQSFTREDLVWLHGDECYHCHGEWNSLDHWPVPVSQGGHHAIYNAVPSCMDCNRRSYRRPDTSTATAIDTTNDKDN